MKALLTLCVALLACSLAYGQTENAKVEPTMIEISYDGVTFQDAAALVSSITVMEGAVTAAHLKHSRRGEINKWQAQLGTPVESRMVEFLVDTGLMPVDVHRYYLRLKFALERLPGSDTWTESPFSERSEYVQFIGRPLPPVRSD